MLLARLVIRPEDSSPEQADIPSIRKRLVDMKTKIKKNFFFFFFFFFSFFLRSNKREYLLIRVFIFYFIFPTRYKVRVCLLQKIKIYKIEIVDFFLIKVKYRKCETYIGFTKFFLYISSSTKDILKYQSVEWKKNKKKLNKMKFLNQNRVQKYKFSPHFTICFFSFSFFLCKRTKP